MALDSYTNIKAAIADFLHRTDLTASIPDFITLAEAQIARRLQKALSDGHNLPRNMVATATVTVAAELVDLPADYIAPIALYIESEAQQLKYVSPENLNAIKARRGETPTSDTPEYYTLIGSQFQFVPVPDTSYSATFVYWQSLTALSGSNASNWILANHPDIYLYGALTQSAPYLKDDARAQTWGTLFVTAMEDMMTADPLPSDMSILRADSGLWFRAYATRFDINTGQ